MDAARTLKPDTRDVIAITDQPVAAEADTLRLLSMMEDLNVDKSRSLGIPVNQEHGVEFLTPILAAFLSSVQSTDAVDDFQAEVAPFEGAVREFFADLTRAPGFVRSHVTTTESEGLGLGLAEAARQLPLAPVYLSQEAQDGVLSAAAALGVEVVTIRSRADGTMDVVELRRAVIARAGEGDRSGAIVVASCGVASTGAVDDVGELRHAASAAGQVYVHTDATLGGMVAAYAPSGPAWSFPHGADSVSVAAHRVLGLPMPWVITLSRRTIETAPGGGAVEGAPDDTLSLGPSRAGLSTLLVWAALRRLGRTGLDAHILRRLETAAYAERRLAQAGAEPRRAPDSLTVTLPRPSERLVAKWRLSGTGDTVGLVCLGHVTSAAIDQLADDLEDEYEAQGCAVVAPAA
ncbi:pyridoxal-dependent decarboxylase [Streptomyces sp. NPDC058686]|uniref:pyridoxal-dependent decarboxylase n=1 Tax=Streptomyces sp. NPDC058686 TaxID=3346599 RepID=UPI00365FCE98